GAVLLVTAPGGRGLLEKTLSELGWEVRRADVYERVPAIYPEQRVDAIRQAGALWTVWTSVEAIQLLRGVLPRDAWERVRAGRWFVVSERLAEAARRIGVSQVSLLRGPGNQPIQEGLLEAARVEGL
ncbi:MAG: uroporphyrinogen-III synthase, partial [Xanthomonadales bacterium]|nr:uroporphyrinogen-III synthase [Xanthomonadales bacterium]